MANVAIVCCDANDGASSRENLAIFSHLLEMSLGVKSDGDAFSANYSDLTGFERPLQKFKKTAKNGLFFRIFPSANLLNNT